MGLLIHTGSAGDLTMEPLDACAARAGLWVQICLAGVPVSRLELSPEGFLLSVETLGAAQALGVFDSVEFIPHETGEGAGDLSAAPGSLYDPERDETALAVATLRSEPSATAKAFYGQIAAELEARGAL